MSSAGRGCSLCQRVARCPPDRFCNEHANDRYALAETSRRLGLGRPNPPRSNIVARMLATCCQPSFRSSVLCVQADEPTFFCESATPSDPNGIRIACRSFPKNRGATRPCDGFRSDCGQFGPEGSCRREPPRTAEHGEKVGRCGNHVAKLLGLNRWLHAPRPGGHGSASLPDHWAREARWWG